MSVNIKLGGKTLNGVTVAQFENADAPGTEIPFYEFGSVPTEEREVSPTTSVQEVVPSSEKLLSKVTVEGVTAEIDSNIQEQNIKEGVTILGVTGQYQTPSQEKAVSPTTSEQEVTPDSGKLLSKVTVSGVTADIDSNIQAQNIKEGVTILGVAGNYQTPSQEKSVSPTTSEQDVTPDSGMLLSKVVVSGVTSSIDSNISANNIKNGVTILGVTGSYDNKLPSAVDGTATSISAEDLGSIQSVRDFAFYDMPNLQSVSLPSSVTLIGNSAFDGCSSITSITIPNSVTSIGNYAFEDCSSLPSIVIPDSVTSIGQDAFRNCSSMTAVALGRYINSIGRDAFADCTNLSAVNCATTSTLSYIQFENPEANPLSYAHNLYVNGQLVTSLSFSKAVSSIGAYSYFGGTCFTELDTNTVSGIVSIGVYAFCECTGLTSVIIAYSVGSIGDSAFYGCSSLEEITIENEEPPTIGTGVFTNTNNCPIYVPAESVDAYKSASGWSTYASRIQAISS